MAEFRLLEKVERLALDDELTLSKYRREGERLGQKEEPKSEVKEISEFEKSEIVEHHAGSHLDSHRSSWRADWQLVLGIVLSRTRDSTGVRSVNARARAMGVLLSLGRGASSSTAVARRLGSRLARAKVSKNSAAVR